MPYAKLKTEILAARNRRHLLLQQQAPPAGSSLLQLSLNLPGAEKQQLAGTVALTNWAREQLHGTFPKLTEILLEQDSLGPWGLFRASTPPPEAKIATVRIEELHDFARLLDIDVYDPAGHPCERRQLNLPERCCLLCSRPAKECIRLQRHSYQQLKEHLEKLLQPFTT